MTSSSHPQNQDFLVVLNGWIKVIIKKLEKNYKKNQKYKLKKYHCFGWLGSSMNISVVLLKERIQIKWADRYLRWNGCSCDCWQQAICAVDSAPAMIMAICLLNTGF